MGCGGGILVSILTFLLSCNVATFFPYVRRRVCFKGLSVVVAFILSAHAAGSRCFLRALGPKSPCCYPSRFLMSGFIFPSPTFALNTYFASASWLSRMSLQRSAPPFCSFCPFLFFLPRRLLLRHYHNVLDGFSCSHPGLHWSLAFLKRHCAGPAASSTWWHLN